MSYSKEDANRLTDFLDKTRDRDLDLTMAPLDTRLAMLRQLMCTLETALKIVHGRHCCEPAAAEPFPGACKIVVEQSLAAINLARRSGLIR